MARPNQSEEKRARFLPVIARCFAERGFRRTTTAELAAACGVQETILYRLWPGKKEMFLAAIEHVYRSSAEIWGEVVQNRAAGESSAERLLNYEAEHLGEFGLYRIIFAGLNETDDPEIRAALRRMFERFQGEIAGRIAEHRKHSGDRGVDVDQAAWAIIGMGMVANISRDVGTFDESERRALISQVGRLLLDG